MSVGGGGGEGGESGESGKEEPEEAAAESLEAGVFLMFVHGWKIAGGGERNQGGRGGRGGEEVGNVHGGGRGQNRRKHQYFP